MLKCAREQKADKCRNTEPGVRVRERRPSWLKDDEQEVKRLGRRRGGGGLCSLLDTHTLGSSATLVKRVTSTDGYLNLFPNSK